MSKLLDPDFWVAAWSKLLEPDFWVTLWSTFLGFSFWGTTWKAFSAPEVVIPLVPLLLIATYVGWKIKGGFDNGKIKGMKTQIDAAEQRLLSANEQRAAGADVDREVETLCKQVFDLKTRVETGVQASELAARVSAITQTVTSTLPTTNCSAPSLGRVNPVTTQNAWGQLAAYLDHQVYCRGKEHNYNLAEAPEPWSCKKNCRTALRACSSRWASWRSSTLRMEG